MTLFSRDLIERAAKTAVQTFVVTFFGLLVVPADVTSIGGWKAALVAAASGACTAAVSALTSLWSKHKGPNPDSASTVV